MMTGYLNPEQILANPIERELLPITKPKDYNFSVKGLNWKKYDNDYLLRTDAVWEKAKLYSYFYSLYKAVISLYKIFSQDTTGKHINTTSFQSNSTLKSLTMSTQLESTKWWDKNLMIHVDKLLNIQMEWQ